MFRRCVAVGAGVLLAAPLVFAAPTDLKVTPGEFIIDHPTLINLGFEWVIDGDANRNASVEVSYRKQGDAEWRRALPMLRLHGERVYQENSWNLVSPNMFAGSILDLESPTSMTASTSRPTATRMVPTRSPDLPTRRASSGTVVRWPSTSTTTT